MFVGYIAPLRLVTRMHLVLGPATSWPTSNSPDPLVRLRIDYGDGRVLLTRLRIPLQPGWG